MNILMRPQSCVCITYVIGQVKHARGSQMTSSTVHGKILLLGYAAKRLQIMLRGHND